MGKDIKILVVDDTVTERKILSTVLSKIENVELLGTASNGSIALSKMAFLKPDLVLLDLYMPGMDGIQTLREIKHRYPDVDVVIISAIDEKNADITLKALQSGALDFIPKPKTSSVEESIGELRTVLSRLISIARTRKYSREARRMSDTEVTDSAKVSEALVEINEPEPLPKTEAALTPEKPKLIIPQKKRKPPKIDIVVIGVSTGGPNALQLIVPHLVEDLPTPILVVQHMPAMFTTSLAHRLDSESKITVVEGDDGRVIEKGVMYIAPGGSHMVVRRNKLDITLGLVNSPPVNSCRPSVDVLFRSVAMIYGGYALSVILTGMGHDGVAGVAAIRRKGGYCLVQDEKSSVIWGMPGAVVMANEADEVIPIARMAERIMEIAQLGRG